jgi:hypothetical protein
MPLCPKITVSYCASTRNDASQMCAQVCRTSIVKVDAGMSRLNIVSGPGNAVVTAAQRPVREMSGSSGRPLRQNEGTIDNRSAIDHMSNCYTHRTGMPGWTDSPPHRLCYHRHG